MFKESRWIKLKRWMVVVLPFFTCRKTSKLNTNDNKTTALPTNPDADLDNNLRPRPLTRNPTNGKTGINQTNFKILFITN